MPKKLNIVAIIPARGGSKRLPRKNIKVLSGKPMIAYSIEAARKSQLIDRVIVSTDDKEIAEIAKKYGAEIPFIRPNDLATDSASTIDVLKHAITFLESHSHDKIDLIVLLQPTSPLITESDIDNAINKIIQTNTTSCVSMCPISERPEWMYSIKNEKPKPFGEKHDIILLTQDLPKLYKINGAIYVSHRDVIMKQNLILDEKNLSAIVMPRERSIDIDTMTDFLIAETLFKARQDGTIK